MRALKVMGGGGCLESGGGEGGGGGTFKVMGGALEVMGMVVKLMEGDMRERRVWQAGLIGRCNKASKLTSFPAYNTLHLQFASCKPHK